MDRPRVIIHNLIRLPDAVALELAAVERLRQGHVWLRYDVRNEPAPELFPAPSRQRSPGFRATRRAARDLGLGGRDIRPFAGPLARADG